MPAKAYIYTFCVDNECWGDVTGINGEKEFRDIMQSAPHDVKAVAINDVIYIYIYIASYFFLLTTHFEGPLINK